MIPERDGEEPHRHEQTLHAIGRLGVGELEAGNRHHHFARRQNDIGEHLPPNSGPAAMIDVELDSPNDHKRKRGQDKADTDLAQWRQRKDPAYQRIKPVVKQRDHCQNEDPVHYVDLFRQHIEREEVEVHLQIHLLALDRPFPAAALVPERPENHGENVNRPDAQQNAPAFLAF